jgi:hypothetical protein
LSRESGRTAASGGEWCGGRLVNVEQRREKVRARADREKVKNFFFFSILFFLLPFILFLTQKKNFG